MYFVYYLLKSETLWILFGDDAFLFPRAVGLGSSGGLGFQWMYPRRNTVTLGEVKQRFVVWTILISGKSPLFMKKTFTLCFALTMLYARVTFAASRGETLRVGVSIDAKNFDPQNVVDTHSHREALAFARGKVERHA